MKKKRLLSLVFSLAIIQGAWAQTSKMSLRDCLIYARDHAFVNRSNRLAVEQSRMDKRIQAAEMLPYIGVGTSGNMNWGRGVDPETNTYATRKTFNNGYSLSMNLPLFDGFVSLNNYRAARMTELCQKKAAENDADQISLAVIKAYYNIMYHTALVRQVESLLESDQQNLAITERQEQLGSKSGADVDAVKAMVASDEYELLNQKNLRRKAMMELKAQMGMPVDEELEVDEEDTLAPCLSMAEEQNSSFPFTHPRIMQAQYSLKRSRYLLHSAYGDFMPTLSLNGGFSTSYYKVFGNDYDTPRFSTQWHNNMGQYIGFSLSVPLFNGFANINRLKRAKYSYRQQQVELDKTKYEVEREMSEALLDVKSSQSEWNAAQAQVTAQERANHAMQRKYELGGVSAFELYTSNSKLAEARATLVGKKIQTAVNIIIYEYYQGKPLISE